MFSLDHTHIIEIHSRKYVEYRFCALRLVFFVWCDQWSTIREDKECDDDEEHKEENDLILSFGDLPRAFQYAERCFHICIEMKKRLEWY